MIALARFGRQNQKRIKDTSIPMSSPVKIILLEMPVIKMMMILIMGHIRYMKEQKLLL